MASLRCRITKNPDGTLNFYALDDLPKCREALPEVDDAERETGNLLHTADECIASVDFDVNEGEETEHAKRIREESADTFRQKVQAADSAALKRKQAKKKRRK